MNRGSTVLTIPKRVVGSVVGTAGRQYIFDAAPSSSIFNFFKQLTKFSLGEPIARFENRLDKSSFFLLLAAVLLLNDSALILHRCAHRSFLWSRSSGGVGGIESTTVGVHPSQDSVTRHMHPGKAPGKHSGIQDA